MLKQGLHNNTTNINQDLDERLEKMIENQVHKLSVNLVMKLLRWMYRGTVWIRPMIINIVEINCNLEGVRKLEKNLARKRWTYYMPRKRDSNDTMNESGHMLL